MYSWFTTDSKGTIASNSGLKALIRVGSKTWALLQASNKFFFEMSHPEISKSQGLTIGIMSLIGLKTSYSWLVLSSYLNPTWAVAHCVKDAWKLACSVPRLVSQLVFFLFARMPAKKVEPLFPPRPTSITPSLGTLASVRMVCKIFFTVCFCMASSQRGIACS